MFNFFRRPRQIPVTPITTHRIRCSTPRSVPPPPGLSPLCRFPPPPRKRYVAPHRVDARFIRRQSSLKARRSAIAKAAHSKRAHASERPSQGADQPASVIDEEQIFLQQFSLLQFSQELAKARALVTRSAEQAPALQKAREERIAQEEEQRRLERERRLERQRMEAALQKQREMKARLEKRRRESIRFYSKNARRICKERLHTGQPAAIPQHPSAEEAGNYLARYDAAWNALKNDNFEIPQPIHFVQIPWPVLAHTTRPDQITYAAVEKFLFHPLRDAKSPKDRLRAEMLRWHPDKFNAKVLSHVMGDQIDVVREASGHVARILTQMMMKLEAGL